MTANPFQERRHREEEIQKRLKAIVKHPGNKVCSECPETKPTWAFLLEPTVEGGERLGALCCFSCYSHHFRLGKSVCVVKSVKMASEWTAEDLAVLEKSGNDMVNSIYEAFLDDYTNEQEDMQLFVENKYQHAKYFSEQAYLEQTLHVSRRVKEQMERATSIRNNSDQRLHDKAPPSLLENKRPSLHRTHSKRSSRLLANELGLKGKASNHDKTRPSLHRSRSKRSSRLLNNDLGLQRATSEAVRNKRRSHSEDMTANISDHIRGFEQSNDNETSPKRPSATRSRSNKERLLALSDDTKRPSYSRSRSEKFQTRRLPPRSSCSQEELAVMSHHVRRSCSRGRSSSRSRSASRRRSNDKLKGMAEYLQSAQGDRSDHQEASESEDDHNCARYDRESCNDTFRGFDTLPRAPRRSFNDSDGVLVRQGSVRRIRMPQRVEQLLGQDLDDTSDEADRKLSYNLPEYLESNRISSASFDRDISELTCIDSSGGEHSDSGKESDASEKDQAVAADNLEAYMKRYRQSRSLEGGALEHEYDSNKFKIDGAGDPMPIRAALESLESTIAPLIRPDSTRRFQYDNKDRTVDPAYWQATLAPFSAKDPSKVGLEAAPATRVPLMDSSLPKRMSTSGRAA